MRYKKALPVILLAVLVSGLLGATAHGATVQEQITTVSATQTNSALAFTTPPGILVIVNDGPDSVYVTLASTTSTTGKFLLKNGESLSLTFVAETQAAPDGMGLICATGKTASVRVGAWR